MVDKWTDWSNCSCAGRQERRRKLSDTEQYPDTCVNVPVETRDCNATLDTCHDLDQDKDQGAELPVALLAGVGGGVAGLVILAIIIILIYRQCGCPPSCPSSCLPSCEAPSCCSCEAPSLYQLSVRVRSALPSFGGLGAGQRSDTKRAMSETQRKQNQESFEYQDDVGNSVASSQSGDFQHFSVDANSDENVYAN